MEKHLITPAQLKLTLHIHQISQKQLAFDFSVSKQVVNGWCNKSIAPAWQRLLLQYFTNKSLEVVNYV